MYLEKGVSCESAPKSCFIRSNQILIHEDCALVADPEARGCFRYVILSQVFPDLQVELHPFLTLLQQIISTLHSESSGLGRTRRMTIRTEHARYGKSNVKRDIGDTYRIVIRHDNPDSIDNKVMVTGTEKHCHFSLNKDLKAMIGKVAVEPNNPKKRICIEQRL